MRHLVGPALFLYALSVVIMAFPLADWNLRWGLFWLSVNIGCFVVIATYRGIVTR